MSTRAKRSATSSEDGGEDTTRRSSKRTRAASAADGDEPPLAMDRESQPDKKNERWKAHQMAEDYVDLASNLVLYPLSQMGPYGYDPSTKSYPIESISTLHYLKSPIRRPTILERWAPIEIAFFEAALGEYGKEFHKIAKEVKSKSTKEVVDFYYVWKKTSHYDRWKATYVPPYLDHSDEEDEEESKAV